MELEQQVISLELAKKLKKLGVKQESLWWWVEFYSHTHNTRIWRVMQKDEDDKINCHISAFTVAELGEMLPKNSYCQRIRDNWWRCQWREPLKAEDGKIINDCHNFEAFTEANVRAKMLIYLIEKGLVTT